MYKAYAGMRSLTRALLAVEQIGRDDLEVVVRGVREGAAAVAVAERPDAGHVGGQAVVDRDVAALVGDHAGLVQPEVVGVRPAADRQQHVGSDDFRRAVCAVDADRHAVVMRREADALRICADRDAFALEDAR